MPQKANHARQGASDARLDVFWQNLLAQRPDGRRSYPRVHAAVPVRVSETPSGAVEVITNDLARCGMQIRCDRATAQRLCPQPDVARDTPTYPMSLQLTVFKLALRVNIHARIVHLTLIPDALPAQEVAMGVEFVNFQNGGETVLERFVEQHLRPAGT